MIFYFSFCILSLFCIVMKIGIAQINSKSYDLDYNYQKIQHTIEQIWPDSDVIVFPEFATTGYPFSLPQNSFAHILDDETFIKRQKELLYKIRDVVLQTKEDLKVIIWCIDYNDAEKLASGKMKKYNAAAIIGKDIQMYHKQHLQNYDGKSESEFFEEGDKDLFFSFWEGKIGQITLGIKAKLSQQQTPWHVDAMFTLSSERFSPSSLKQRKQIANINRQANNSFFVNVNQVWAENGVVLEWASIILDKEGNKSRTLKHLEECIKVINTDDAGSGERTDQQLWVFLSSEHDTYHAIFEAMKLWIKDYLDKNGIRDVVIGVSWWVDSALNLYLLSKVLAPEQIHAIYLPTQFNSNNSLLWSQKLAGNLWIHLDIGPIGEILASFEQFSEDCLDVSLSWVSHENIQARIRGDILMNIANNKNAIVINNSNQTELALGYWTLYGDLIWAISLLWDLNKHEVYQLCRYLNDIEWIDIIPHEIIERKASAELANGQVDPFDYERLSYPIEEILYGFPLTQIAHKYSLPLEELQQLKIKIQRNEFKRRQVPFIIKMKEKNSF